MRVNSKVIFLQTIIKKLISTTTESGEPTTTETEIFSTTNFEESLLGCFRFGSPRPDDGFDEHPQIPKMNGIIDGYYTLNKVFFISISFNKDNIIRIYTFYIETSFDDSWWVYKFKGQ